MLVERMQPPARSPPHEEPSVILDDVLDSLRQRLAAAHCSDKACMARNGLPIRGDSSSPETEGVIDKNETGLFVCVYMR